MTEETWGQAALRQAMLGRPVIPIHWIDANGRCDCGRDAGDGPGQDKSPGKHPRTAHGLLGATTATDTINRWIEQWPQSNLAMLTGAPSGTIVVDVDIRHGGLESLEALAGDDPQQWGTHLMAKTGGGGFHLFIKHPDRLIRNRVNIRPGIDIRGDGGYVLISPSNHISGGRYEWLEQGEPGDMPDWLAALLNERERAAVVPDVIPEGQRDHTLTSMAGSMRGRGFTPSAILAALRDENQNGRLKPPMDDYDLRRIAGSAAQWAGELPDLNPNNTDTGNGLRLLHHYGKDLRYVHAWGQWLIWNGRYWEKDTNAEIMRRAKHVADLMIEDARAMEEGPEQIRELKWALNSENASKLTAMTQMAQSELLVSTKADELDRQPMKLNAMNGTIDLITGALIPHDRADMLTKMVNSVYDPAAKAPLWDAFLTRVFDGDTELISYIDRMIGYMLTGLVSEQKLFFLYGTGKNGKTTFIETMQALMADYAQVADFTTFLAKEGGNDGPRNDLARLPGARLVTAVEVEQNRRLNEALIKNITGGDKITARFMFKEFFDFHPEFKVWLVGNHKPNVKGNDEGFWRRFNIIPFTIEITEAERDPDLGKKLREELPGILARGVRGCLDWQRIGMDAPLAVISATQSYRDEMDSLQNFIAERCIIDAKSSVGSADLYRTYDQWCEDNGERPLSQKIFAVRLSEKGINKKKAKNNDLVYAGVKLQTDGTKINDAPSGRPIF